MQIYRDWLGRQLVANRCGLLVGAVEQTSAAGQPHQAIKGDLARSTLSRHVDPAAARLQQVHAASIQDHDGVVPLLKISRRSCPFVEFGDRWCWTVFETG